MCLFATTKRPYTAKRDLTCYKAIKPSGRAFLHNFIYKKGVPNVTEMKKTNDKESPDCIFSKYGGKTFNTIGDGFHSAKNPERFLNPIANYFGRGLVIARFIIPKGSKYYLDNTGLVVSNQIIFKEVIFDTDDMADLYFKTRSSGEFTIRDKSGKMYHVMPSKLNMNKFKTWER